MQNASNEQDEGRYQVRDNRRAAQSLFCHVGQITSRKVKLPTEEAPVATICRLRMSDVARFGALRLSRKKITLPETRVDVVRASSRPLDPDQIFGTAAERAGDKACSWVRAFRALRATMKIVHVDAIPPDMNVYKRRTAAAAPPRRRTRAHLATRRGGPKSVQIPGKRLALAHGGPAGALGLSCVPRAKRARGARITAYSGAGSA
jgi:hypothetical protein